MTTNQIAYQSLLEQARSNRAREAETSRSNRAQELETNRSNLARELENYRSNTTREKETERHNRATEEDAVLDRRFNYVKLGLDTATKWRDTNLKTLSTILSKSGEALAMLGLA